MNTSLTGPRGDWAVQYENITGRGDIPARGPCRGVLVSLVDFKKISTTMYMYIFLSQCHCRWH